MVMVAVVGTPATKFPFITGLLQMKAKGGGGGGLGGRLFNPASSLAVTASSREGATVFSQPSNNIISSMERSNKKGVLIIVLVRNIIACISMNLTVNQ